MNSLTDAFKIPDTQSEHDDRHLAIQRVGVRHVCYPLKLLVARSGAVVTTYVALRCTGSSVRG